MSGNDAPLVDPAFDLSGNEKQIFDYLLKPDDSYDANGVYWADMPIFKRIKFVTGYNYHDTMREVSTVWKMMKKTPSPPLDGTFAMPSCPVQVSDWKTTSCSPSATSRFSSKPASPAAG